LEAFKSTASKFTEDQVAALASEVTAGDWNSITDLAGDALGKFVSEFGVALLRKLLNIKDKLSRIEERVKELDDDVRKASQEPF